MIKSIKISKKWLFLSKNSIWIDKVVTEVKPPDRNEKKYMAKVKLTITESRCRSGFHKKGQEFIIDETICPPICMEL